MDKIIKTLETPTDLYLLFKKFDGLMAGHTVFRTGDHGDGWIEKGSLIRQPSLLEGVINVQAEALKKNFPTAELIVGSSQCGTVVASFMARALNLPLALTTKEEDGLIFNRMHVPKPPLNIVFVDDLVFSGSDLRAHINLFESSGFSLLGFSVWVNRQSDYLNGYPIINLMPAPFQTFTARDCPLCKMGKAVKYTHIRE